MSRTLLVLLMESYAHLQTFTCVRDGLFSLSRTLVKRLQKFEFAAASFVYRRYVNEYVKDHILEL